jgi:nitroimidazol reductase NimA-like FMN-containing flavoprotein (pyridoxamine 5'-phosphate oxidase superfamily)
MPADSSDHVATSLPQDPQTTVNRYKWLQSFDVADLYDILDSGLVAHIAYSHGEFPVVIPMAYARQGHSLLMHGSTGAGISKAAGGDLKLSATVTLIDGLVYEKSLYDSTVNYRSAMIFGVATPVDISEKEGAVRTISERLMPGRWTETPNPTKKQLASTYVIRLPLDQASVKIRRGGPSYDASPDLWTGHVPITTQLGDPVTQHGAHESVSPSVALAHELFKSKIERIPT